jgi:hypothetical protein
LLRHLTGGAVAFPENFTAKGARLAGKSFIVFGKDGAMEVSLANPARPEAIGPLTAEKVGHLVDVVADGDHSYLLGDRGLQIASNSGKKVSDSIQVHGDQAMALSGRYVFVAGARSLEVVDVGPYQVNDVAALDVAQQPEPAAAAPETQSQPATTQSMDMTAPASMEPSAAPAEPPAAPAAGDSTAPASDDGSAMPNFDEQMPQPESPAAPPDAAVPSAAPAPQPLND